MKKLMMMAMVVAMGVAGSALAGTTIGYSGQLRDAEGKALSDLNQRITFALYTAPSGGEALWTATRNVVLSQEGYFNVELEDNNASVSPSLEKVLQENSTLYIGLTPQNATTEIAPRQRILETPHAAVASAGVNGFKVSGTATFTTIQAVTVQQQYTNGTQVAYGDLLPKGVVVMWNGAADEIPAGWALCDGKNYGDLKTPDLRGRFIVGAGSKYGVGNTGGEETHKLTVDEMPKHAHTYNEWTYNAWKSERRTDIREALMPGTSGTAGKGVDLPFTSTGGDQAHENRPPYYALCYIIKL